MDGKQQEEHQMQIEENKPSGLAKAVWKQPVTLAELPPVGERYGHKKDEAHMVPHRRHIWRFRQPRRQSLPSIVQMVDGAPEMLPEKPRFIPRAVGLRQMPMTQDVDDPAHSEKETPVRGERALWRAVIMQMLTDAACQSKKYEAELQRGKARQWLLGMSRDFQTVCDYADYDPILVRRHARKALAGGCTWRLPPSETSNAFQRR